MNTSPHPLTAEALRASIGRRFDAIARASGDRIAIRTPRGEIGYRELAEWSDRLASQVYRHPSIAGCAPGALVATLLPQGIEAIVAQLGITKSGGCYMPLDPGQSAESLRNVVEHSGCRLVITSRPLLDAAAVAMGQDGRILEIEPSRTEGGSQTRLPEVHPDSPATLYYTSGSTGRPKGVLDTHRNVLHNVLRYTQTLDLGPNDRLSLIQSPAFSGATSSVLGTLLNGAMLCSFDLHVEVPNQLADWLEESGVTVYHSVPAIFRALVAGRREFPLMRIIRLEGDRVLARDAELFKSSFRPTCVLVNGFGTTETGLARQFFLSHETIVADGLLPIGFPVPDVDAQVVDDSGELQGFDQIGEIIVRSRYLALGYWNDPSRTADRFSSCADGTGTRSYRTGDLGRMRSDGCLEYVGRRDSSIKIRGRLVDSGEVERAIVSIPGVTDAVVVSRDASSGEAEQVAIVVAPESITAAKIRVALRASLPDSVPPAVIKFRDALPHTPFGKIDRRAVLEMAIGMEEGLVRPSGGQARETPLETRIAGIWADVLGVSEVSMEIPFLGQGGDSLHALQILLRIGDELDLEMTPAVFFALPTVVSQARYIETLAADGGSRAKKPGFP